VEGREISDKKYVVKFERRGARTVGGEDLRGQASGAVATPHFE